MPPIGRGWDKGYIVYKALLIKENVSLYVLVCKGVCHAYAHVRVKEYIKSSVLYK